MDPGYLPDALEAKLRVAADAANMTQDQVADSVQSSSSPRQPEPGADIEKDDANKSDGPDFTGEQRTLKMKQQYESGKLFGVKSWTYYKYNPEEMEPEPARYCNTCDMWQSLRSKHCNSCRKCVARYDHHCIWLGNCVGERSHSLFWWYLLFQSVVIIWGLYEIATAIKRHGYSSDAGEAFEEFIMSSGFTLIVFLFIVLWSWLPICLLCYHSYLLFTNQTTWEFNRKQRITYLSGLKPGSRPFDHGILGNIRLLCCTPKLLRWRSHVAPGRTIGGTETE